MAVNFPSSPSAGDIYSSGDRNWTFDGTIWRARPNVALDALPVANGGTGVKTLEEIYANHGDPLLVLLESGSLASAGTTVELPDFESFAGYDNLLIIGRNVTRDTNGAIWLEVKVNGSWHGETEGTYTWAYAGFFLGSGGGNGNQNSNDTDQTYRVCGTISNIANATGAFLLRIINHRANGGKHPNLFSTGVSDNASSEVVIVGQYGRLSDVAAQGGPYPFQSIRFDSTLNGDSGNWDTFEYSIYGERQFSL